MLNRKLSKKLIIAANRKVKERKYWVKKLAGISGKSSFPYDYNEKKDEGVVDIENFETTTFRFSGESFSRLMKIGNWNDRTLHVVLTAGLIAAIDRYIGKKDIIVCTPIYKQDSEFEFLNSVLALRMQLEEDMTFKELLLLAKDTIIEAVENYSYPIEMLPDALGLHSNGNGFPLFDIAVLLENIHDRSCIRHININMVFSFSVTDASMEAVIEYNPCFYEQETARRIGSHYQNLVEQAVFDINMRLCDIEMLSKEEKEQILFDFNDTNAEYSRDKTLHELFEEQAARTPANIAVVFKEKKLTYEALNKKANRLANFLRARGVGKDTLVAVILEPSIDLVVSILGILKAGGAYLPIDPNYPQERVLLILNDNDVLFLLTDAGLLGRHSLTAMKNLQLVRVEPFRTETRPLSNFDSLPIPDRSMVDYEKYSQYIGHAMVKNTLSLQGTRGCPFNCAYCHRIWPKTHAVRSAENIFSELMLYYNMGVRRFSFIDDIFNLNIRNSSKFFQLILKNKLTVQLFFPNGLRGDVLTKDYIDLMVEAGTVNIDLALETASPRLQKFIGKNLKIEKLRENIEYIARTYPHVILDFNAMYGFPSETEEEALMTLEFIESIKWIDFAFVFILKIHPNTDIGKLALQHGVSAKAISRSLNYSYHDIPETLPFSKNFARQFQFRFMKEYFFSKERLLHVLPHQMKIATENELVQKYNNYLPMKIKCFSDIIEHAGISREELGDVEFLPEDYNSVQGLNEKIKNHFPVKARDEGALRVLFLDMSELFSSVGQNILHGEIVEPTGLLYIMTYLNERFGSRVEGKVAKSMIDFDSYDQLKNLVADFKPDLIGIRTLSYYKDFFHRSVSVIRNWGVDVPIISGGPYATMDYRIMLQDSNVDLAVLGEGELTTAELVEKILENGKKLPPDDQLKDIKSIAFIPRKEKSRLKRLSRDIIPLDRIPGELEGYSDRDPGNINQPGDLLYLISTSGSTGNPKSVMLEHRNLNNLIHFELSHTAIDFSRVLQFASIGFDVSAQEIFSTLLSGGELYLISSDMKSDIFQLFELIEKNRIKTLFLPPAFLRFIFSDPGYAARFPGHIRDIVAAGEQLEVTEPLRKYLEKNRVRLHNHYGPTETHVVTALTMEPNDKSADLPPIGRPISNTKIFIIDKQNNILPIGVSGELYISGDNVGRGYCNWQELTHERFIDGVFEGTGRLYRTGDIAKWLADGTIQFLGRDDQQVKIRGFRIELGEIEKRLQDHDEVKEVVVDFIKRKTAGNTGDDNYLCAYIVTESELDTADLWDYLARELPDYMIPSNFVQLEKFPLTPNGKLDRKALVRYEAVGATEKFYAPRNEIEKKLVKIWSEVLGIEKDVIGIDADFFDLGGHSLRATILVSKIHKEFSIKLVLAEMFNMPTVRKLAEYIKGTAKEKYHSIKSVEKKEYYELSSAQKRLYILQQIEVGGIGYNMPYIGVLEAGVGRIILEQTFRKLIKRHESLRTSFIMKEETPVQQVCDEAEFEVEYYDLKEEGGEEKIINDFVRVFDLCHAPLMRVGLIKVGKERYILMFDMHHIITDGFSHSIFLEEFMALYGREELPPFRIQYKDYAEWQKSESERFAKKRQEEYWIKAFEEESPVLNLFTDHSRPVVQSFKGSDLKFEMNREETRELKALASGTDLTLYMVVLALFNIMLSKLSGDEDIVIGTPIAGRSHTDLQKIIGMFVNTLALRNYPAGAKRVIDFLAEVKERTLEAFENQDYPFENLVEKVAVNRNTGRNPLFDVVFAFQNVDLLQIELDGLRLSQYEHDFGIAKFDLTLNMVETGDKLVFILEYCTELFEAGTIERYMRYFKNMVSSVLLDPGVTIGEIEIIPGEEKKQVLFDFNDTKTGYPEDKTIYEFFEEQVEKTPDNTALVFEDKALTYRVLNEKANQLAIILRERGVSTGVVVGLMVERSVRMIVGILGILKAGGAYLSIAPDYPENRILSILNDSGVPLLVTDECSIKPLDYLSLRNIRSGQVKGVVTPPRLTITDFDVIPIPDRTLVNYEKYHNCIGNAPVKNAITILTSRGCPYNCMFCHKIWPKQHVVRSAENVFEEIRYSYDAGVRRFVFLDDIFNLDMKNSSRLLEKIVKNSLDIRLFFPNGLRGDILTKDYIDLLVEAGTVNFSVALETASHRLQKMMRKNLNIEKFQENLEYITKNYPHIILEMELMFGFPTETEEEALLTFDFLKNLKWIHFPNLNILKIYPNTDISKLAVEHGIPEELIERSSNMAFHELPETLPFSKKFARQYQARFLSEYFLSKDRLLQVLPFQMKILSDDELVKKYDSYLPAAIKGLPDIFKIAGINEEELGDAKCLQKDAAALPGYSEKIKKQFPIQKKAYDALRVLLLDLSQLFRSDASGMLYDVVEAPLGLMYLLTYINKEFGSKINGKIAKSRVDFDSYDELKRLIDDFKPQVIGVRTLSYYNALFHKTVSLIKYWFPGIPIISGGPYSTTDYQTILSDINVDVIVIGEGEVTFSELLREIIKNQGKLPGDHVLKQIPGITFVPGQHKEALVNGNIGRDVLLLDRIRDEKSTRDTRVIENPGPLSHANDLAFVLYTSGSTGIPKGVAMEHRPLFNLILWQFQEETYSKGAATLQFTPYTFDVSFQEIFSTLCSGGKLVLISEEMRRDMLNLLDFLKEKNIERLFLPFVALQHLASLAENSEQVPFHLREIITAGEKLKITPAISRFFKRLKNCVLHNQYGPTESHVVTAFTLTGAVDSWPTFPPIGYPIANSRICLLDPYRKLVPIGVAGELFIGGDSLARGYLNRTKLTEEKFIDNPYCHGERLYSTGDLTRWLPDGNIEFLGRIDHQVKIRGFRVEPVEIESHLLNHDIIKDALVILISKSRVTDMGEEEDKYLTAYIVADKELKTPELREYLSQQLPEYMIPGFFIQIDKIPLTSTGKVDKRALQELEGAGIGKGYISPRDEIEKKLEAIWSEVLGKEEGMVGIDANFFELGGHSLKATILVSKMHKEFDVKVPLVEIFKKPTIRDLSVYIKALAKDRYFTLKPVEKKEYYPLFSAQKRLYVIQRVDEETICYNMPTVVLIEGDLKIERLEEIFGKLMERHESLRTSFIDIDHQPVQRIHDNVPFEIECFCLNNSEQTQEKEEKAIIKNFVKAFDLGNPPLLRVGLIKRSKQEYILMIDIHHIITDGISDAIFIKEFIALYKGEELPLLRIRYKDFSEWQNHEMEGEAIKQQEVYWLKEFEGKIPLLNLPADFVRPTVQSFDGSSFSFSLGPGVTGTLKKYALKEGATLYILLLAILNVLFSKLSRQEDIVIGTSTSGRRRADLEQVVGMFVNTLALRSYPGGNKTFGEFLAEVKENTLKAFENQDYQFERLVEKLTGKPDMSSNPLFNVGFVLQTQGIQEANIPGLELKVYGYEYTVSRIDMIFNGEERGESLFFAVEYSTNLFKEETIKKYIKYFKEIISSVMENGDIRLKDIKLTHALITADTSIPQIEFGL
jgi:amino acid adenylation domain-containing protein